VLHGGKLQDSAPVQAVFVSHQIGRPFARVWNLSSSQKRGAHRRLSPSAVCRPALNFVRQHLLTACWHPILLSLSH
jgi:hypothetical protein